MGVEGVDDAQAARELEQVSVDLPNGLDLAWLGVSGYRLTYEGVSLFIDPYVSRVPLRAFLLRRRTLPDPVMIERYAHSTGHVAGVLVGHTHFDHAVDAPAIAQRHRAKAYGSASLAHLMRLHGLGDLAVEVTPHEPYELGPFVVRFIPSRHSKLLFGRKIPMDGPLTCGPMRSSAYSRRGLRHPDRCRRHHHLPPGKCGPQRLRAAWRAGRRVSRGSCRTQRHAVLLGAHLAETRSTNRRADALRQLLLTPGSTAGLRQARQPRRCPARGPPRGPRHHRRGVPADRRLSIASRCARERHLLPSCRTPWHRGAPRLVHRARVSAAFPSHLDGCGHRARRRTLRG